MASISTDKNGNRTIQFVAADTRRKSIRLGKVSLNQTRGVKLRVEALNSAIISRCPFDDDTARWLANIGDDLHGKLSAVGLTAARGTARLAEFIDGYIAGRTDVKKSTVVSWGLHRDRLTDYFGEDRQLSSITPGDADKWCLWLKERYSNSTVGRTVKLARQYFRAAIRNHLITSNPFADVKAPAQVNEARKYFIDRDTTQRILDACPDAEWRLIVALSRYAGIRTPSELIPLQWVDVLWEQGKFRVHSPKTEHHEGGAERWVPIFPELRPYLEDAFEQAEPGTVYLISRYRELGQNLRTQLQRIMRKAGVKAWPKLFHNLRASRETELAATFPLHVVCTWIGNSALIAQKHYLTVTETDYRQAASVIGEVIKSGAECGAGEVQKAVQSELIATHQDMTGEPEPSEDANLTSSQTSLINHLHDLLLGATGLEPVTPSVSKAISQLRY